MRPRQEVLLALVEKQTKLIAIQGQLLDRIRKFGDDGASMLRQEARDICDQIQQLEHELHTGSPQRRALALT